MQGREACSSARMSCYYASWGNGVWVASTHVKVGLHGGLKHQCCGRGDQKASTSLAKVQQETLDQGNKVERQKGLLTNILH